MRTQIIARALTTLIVFGLSAEATSQTSPISGERALLNRVEATPVTSTASHYSPIDPAGALLGRVAEPSGFSVMRSEAADASPARIGAERALLNRGA